MKTLCLVAIFGVAFSAFSDAQGGGGAVNLRQTQRYDLRGVLGLSLQADEPQTHFTLSPDGRSLASELWSDDGTGCKSPLRCVKKSLALIDLPSGRVMAQTTGEAPELIAFSNNPVEVLSSIGPDLVFLDGHHLSELRRTSADGLFPPAKFRARLVSADLSSDDRRVGALYRVEAVESGEPKGARTIEFVEFDARTMAVRTRCTVPRTPTGDATFEMKLEADENRFFYASKSYFVDDQIFSEMDLPNCAVRRSLKIDQAIHEILLSPNQQLIVLSLGGDYPKSKVKVLRYSDGKEIWNAPAKSENDMLWRVSISKDSRYVAVSTDRYGETWWDALSETHHVANPGVEVRDLESGRVLGSVQYARRLPSTVGFSSGTKLVQFTQQNQLAAIFEDEFRLYDVAPK